MNALLFAIWFFWPAAIANVMPVFANKIPVLNRWTTPMDFGKSWRGKRILGNNKTWRGFVTGVAAASLVAGTQYFVLHPSAFALDLNGLGANMAVGALIGLGALTGDAVESFLKRQKGIPSGQTWFPFDQIDYIVGGILFVYPVFHLSMKAIGTIFVFFFVLHLVFTYIGYLLGLRDQPI